TYAALLSNRSWKDPAELDAVRLEAEWIQLKEVKASPQARAKALYVTGLALRNQGRFAEARDALTESGKQAADLRDGAWAKKAQQALAELTDAKAYFLPQIQTLRTAGDLKGALEHASAALKALPDSGALLGERGLLTLELNKGKKLSPEQQQQIRADAE